MVTTPSCPKTQTNSRLARRAVSIVIDPWRAPDLGCVGGDVGDSGSPYAQGKHRPATGCHAPGRRPGPRHGPHLDQNVLAGYAAVALALILDPSGSRFSDAARPCQRPNPPLWRKRGTRKSRLETKTENEASSALLALSLVTPTPAKPRQPRVKSHPSLQCHNWADWVADGVVWSYPYRSGMFCVQLLGNVRQHTSKTTSTILCNTNGAFSGGASTSSASLAPLRSRPRRRMRDRIKKTTPIDTMMRFRVCPVPRARR